MAMTYPMGVLYVNGAKVADVTNLEVVSHRKPDPTLPKPSRVEKWQRWRDSRGVMFTATEDTGNGDRWRLRKDGDIGHWFGSDMLARSGWTFLGYAKPDKVEVGQRWRNDGNCACSDLIVRDVDGEQVWFGDSAYGHASSMISFANWEYLGMAESADTDEQRRMTDVDVEAVLHTDAAPRVPITKKVDPKAEARRANEEAAKRLIANPPDWAYPKAWMCAVLAAQEYCNRDTRWPLALAIEDKSRGLMAVCRRAHDRERQHTDASEADRAAYDAYARGMERPTPLLTRQGGKGGISTCDLGVDYE